MSKLVKEGLDFVHTEQGRFWLAHDICGQMPQPSSRLFSGTSGTKAKTHLCAVTQPHAVAGPRCCQQIITRHAGLSRPSSIEENGFGGSLGSRRYCPLEMRELSRFSRPPKCSLRRRRIALKEGTGDGRTHCDLLGERASWIRWNGKCASVAGRAVAFTLRPPYPTASSQPRAGKGVCRVELDR